MQLSLPDEKGRLPELSQLPQDIALGLYRIARVDLGEDAAARPLFERALAIDEAALEPAHPQLVLTLGLVVRSSS